MDLTASSSISSAQIPSVSLLERDGVSIGEKDGLDAFYKNFVEPRVNGVKTGGKCTVMMYGPTGSGKSHTMFGCQ